MHPFCICILVTAKTWKGRMCFQIYVHLYMASQAFRACLPYINIQGKAWRDSVTCLNVLNNQLYWCCLANGPVSSPLAGHFKEGAQDSSSDKASCFYPLTSLHITLHVSSRPSHLCICIFKAMKDLRQQKHGTRLRQNVFSRQAFSFSVKLVFLQ